jgi:BASS family bile acid:Na+ symporter
MIEASIAASVFYLLLVVGTKVSIADFRLIIAHPTVITLVTLAHVFLVPVIVTGIVLMIPLDAWMATGMILIAASPTGAISSYYVTLARGNAAMSVTLCGVTSILSCVTAPLSCLLIAELLMIEPIRAVPFGLMLSQTIPTVLLPVVLGIVIRHLYPSWTLRHQEFMERLSFVAIGLLIIVILASQYDFLTPPIVGSAIVMAILFTVVLLVLGWTLARFTAPSLGNSVWSGIMFGFPARNLGLAALLAANVFGMIELAAFGVVFFIVQFFVLLPLALVCRHRVKTF